MFDARRKSAGIRHTTTGNFPHRRLHLQSASISRLTSIRGCDFFAGDGVHNRERLSALAIATRL